MTPELLEQVISLRDECRAALLELLPAVDLWTASELPTYWSWLADDSNIRRGSPRERYSQNMYVFDADGFAINYFPVEWFTTPEGRQLMKSLVIGRAQEVIDARTAATKMAQAVTAMRR